MRSSSTVVSSQMEQTICERKIPISPSASVYVSDTPTPTLPPYVGSGLPGVSMHRKTLTIESAMSDQTSSS